MACTKMDTMYTLLPSSVLRTITPDSMLPNPRSLEEFLGAADSAGNVLVHAKRLLHLSYLYGEIAPAHLCRTSRLVNYKSGVVIIHATNGATASKLRQLAATLADGFSRRGVECSGVLVKVQPFENQSPPEMGRLKPLSDETFLKLGSLRETLPEGDLRQAIDALIQRSPKRE